MGLISLKSPSSYTVISTNDITCVSDGSQGVETIRSQTIQLISNSDNSVKMSETIWPKTIQTVLKF